MKRAISLRAKADQKARRYTKLLADAIGATEDAAMQLNVLNQLYNVDVSTYTILTQALHANGGQRVAGAPVIPPAQMAKALALEAAPAPDVLPDTEVATIDLVAPTVHETASN